MLSRGSIVSGVALTASLCVSELAWAQAAAEYYVDDVNGNDSNDGGTPDTAIASTAGLPEGFGQSSTYTAYFKRGGAWTVESLRVPSGATIATFGDGARPLIQCTSGGISLQGNATLKGLKVRGEGGTGISIMGSGNLVEDCEVDGSNSNMGMGVGIMGEGNTVVGNIVHDLNLSASSGDMNTSGGAEAYMVMASNNEIAYNSAINCQSINETLGGHEGGCLEIVNGSGGTVIENVHFHHNYCVDSVGLFEGCSGNFTGADAIQENRATIRNSSVSYNLSIDSKWLYLLQPVNTIFESIYFENNTIVHTSRSDTMWTSGARSAGVVVASDAGYEVASDFTLTAAGIPEVVVRNNLFIEIDGPNSQFGGGLFMGDVSIHTNNMFVNTSPGGWSLGATELQVDWATAGISDQYRLTGTGSPAYNAGTDAPYAEDIDGHPVPCDGVPDIGASEYCADIAQTTTVEPAGSASPETVGVGPASDGTVAAAGATGTGDTTVAPDGTITTTEPDGSVTTIAPDGTVTTTAPDGTVTSTPAESTGDEGGCGCRVAAAADTGSKLAWFTVAMVALLLRRRRRL